MNGTLRPPLFGRLSVRHWVTVDVLVACLLLVAAAHAAERVRERGLPIEFGYLLLLLWAAPVAARRLWPVPAFTLALLAAVTVLALGVLRDPHFPVAMAIYPIAVRATKRRAAIALALALAATPLGLLAIPGLPGTGGSGGLAVTDAGIIVAAWAIGVATRQRRAYQRAERDLAIRQVVSQERLGIARELHDVIAHGMGLVTVQAGVARYALSARPDETHRVLASIEETSRSGLRELRYLLRTLRGVDGPHAGSGHSPAPGLDELDALVARLAETGLRVTVETTGGADLLPAGVDLFAYRIIQEALTNVVKHANAAPVRVALERGPDLVRIEVVDEGTGRVAQNADTGGHGIVGMRERVAVYGGEFEAGPLPGRGFRVRASLPFGGVAG